MLQSSGFSCDRICYFQLFDFDGFTRLRNAKCVDESSELFRICSVRNRFQPCFTRLEDCLNNCVMQSVHSVSKVLSYLMQLVWQIRSLPEIGFEHRSRVQTNYFPESYWNCKEVIPTETLDRYWEAANSVIAMRSKIIQRFHLLTRSGLGEFKCAVSRRLSSANSGPDTS